MSNKWYDRSVFYHIYPIGMCNAPKVNEYGDTEYRLEDLKRYIPHLKKLSVGAIYIGPLFQSKTHGYDTTDYMMVDSRLGDNKTFTDFVAECHDNDIKVVVDGVFNHTGRDFFAFKDIIKNRENSEYKDWYKGINFGGQSPYNDNFSYEGWRGCYELVTLNMQNQAVRDYMMSVIEFWVKEYDIDGIRLDCADILDFGFLEQMRSYTDSLKEDFWLMGEVIHGDYTRWVNDKMLHSVTNYEMHKGIYSGHNDYNYFEIAHSARRCFAKDGIYGNIKLYNFIDNHDVDRIIEKLKTKEHIYNVHMLLFTFPGIPSIYYGSEWGIKGKKEGNSDDPLRPYVDVDNIADMDKELFEYVCKLSKIRCSYKSLISGTYEEARVTNKQYAFKRVTEDEVAVIIVNADDNMIEMSVPVGADKYNEIIAHMIEDDKVSYENGNLTVNLDANSGAVIILKK